jgi:hypothetical protein
MAVKDSANRSAVVGGFAPLPLVLDDAEKCNF